MSPDTYAAIRGKSIVDLVKDNLADARAVRHEPADKHKLAAWKALLNQTAPVIASAQCTTDLATMLGATQANVSKAAMRGLGVDVLTTKVSDDLDGADMYSAIAVLAAACNSNPVIFMKYPGELRVQGARHQHRVALPLAPPRQRGHAGQLPARTRSRCSQTIDGYYAQKFANLVGMLDSIPEGDGHAARQQRRRLVQRDVGRQRAQPQQRSDHSGRQRGGYFKTGWTINVDTATRIGRPDAAATAMSECADGTATR